MALALLLIHSAAELLALYRTSRHTKATQEGRTNLPQPHIGPVKNKAQYGKETNQS